MSLFILSKQETRQTTPDELVKAIINSNIKVQSKVLYNDINLYRLSDSVNKSSYSYGTQYITFEYTYDNYVRVVIPDSNYFYFMYVYNDHVVMFTTDRHNEIIIPDTNLNEIDFFQFECAGVYNCFSVPVLIDLINYLKGFINNAN